MKSYFEQDTALGSKAKLTIVSSDDPDAVFARLWREIFQFESRFSRFLPESELSRFNKNAGLRVAISPEFRRILSVSRRLAIETEGLFNPFILPALQRSGYVGSLLMGYQDDPVDNFAARSVVSIEGLEIGSDWARIPYGTALDLGGCGKGYIADQLSRHLPHDVQGYWISMGGDLVFGGTDLTGDQWQTVIEAPLPGVDRHIARITVPTSSYAIATSGVTKRQKQTWHHIIDPRTLQPAKTDILQVTVCTKRGVNADVLASCAVILGSTQAPQFLAKHGIESYVLCIRTGADSYDVVTVGENVKNMVLSKKELTR